MDGPTDEETVEDRERTVNFSRTDRITYRWTDGWTDGQAGGRTGGWAGRPADCRQSSGDASLQRLQRLQGRLQAATAERRGQCALTWRPSIHQLGAAP